MSKSRNALRAGLFIIVSIALIFAVAVGIKGLGVFEPAQERLVAFALKDDIGGLRVGDDVRIGGYKVGVIRKIHIVPMNQVKLPIPPATAQSTPSDPIILVRFTIPTHYQIAQNAKIIVQSSLTGSSNLNFESLGNGDAGGLPADVALVGRPGSLAEFLASLGDTGPQLRGAMQQINEKTVPAMTGLLTDVRTNTVPHATGLLSDVRTQTVPRVNSILDDVKTQTVPKVNVAADNAGKMMNEVGATFGESKTDLKTTIANLAAATGDIKARMPEILDRVRDVMKGVQGAVEKTNVALEDVKKTVANTRDMSASAKSVIAGNKGKLDGMIASLKATSDNLKGASAEIRHAPWRLLYKPAKGEMANLNLFDSTRQFADGASDLADAAQALRDAVNDKQASPEELKKLMENVEDRFGRFSEVEQRLWKAVQE